MITVLGSRVGSWLAGRRNNGRTQVPDEPVIDPRRTTVWQTRRERVASLRRIMKSGNIFLSAKLLCRRPSFLRNVAPPSITHVVKGPPKPPSNNKLHRHCR